jgi:hypothetical protein
MDCLERQRQRLGQESPSPSCVDGGGFVLAGQRNAISDRTPSYLEPDFDRAFSLSIKIAQNPIDA